MLFYKGNSGIKFAQILVTLMPIEKKVKLQSVGTAVDDLNRMEKLNFIVNHTVLSSILLSTVRSALSPVFLVLCRQISDKN